MQKKWKYISEETLNAEKIQKVKQITNSDLLARLLVSRGIDTEKKAKDYLEPLKMAFTSPYDFCDMEKAVERILKAVENKEFILIHGDFDADGITSTALLSKVMTLLGANYDIYIPNRETESHGLSTKAILKMRAKNALKLVVTCDCATNDIREINLLKAHNIDTIVTDHHEAGQELPDAYAIINPKVEGNLNSELDVEKIENLCMLAGVGVAFKLALAILDKIGQPQFAEELLPLVATGTIADIVPVLGENRAFIKLGLENIQKGKNKGLFELLKTAGINPEEGLKAENITYQVAPRLNATGRLDTADEGYKLLISDNKSEIEFLCSNLKNKNLLRQKICDDIFTKAVSMYETSSEKNEKAIVLYKEDWHLGVIGIVASKLIEKYNKPVLMMCKDPNSDIIRSSVRSISGINIFDLLSEMKDYFLTFGGHKGAAGLSFDPKEHPFEEIKQKIYQLAKEYSQGLDLTPVLKIDLQILPNELTTDLINDIEKLEPCGAANPYPIFAVDGLDLQEQKIIGQKQNHLKFICKDNDNNTFECVFWNSKELNIMPKTPIDIAFYPKINTFNGNTTLQLDIQDAHYQEIKKDIKIYDHRKKKNILPLVCDFANKNIEKVFIYTNSKSKKDELRKMGFSEELFIPKEDTLHLILFDYPDDENTLKQITENLNPQKIHFMNFENENDCLNEFINKILGMIKYASHNKNGEFDITTVSEILGINEHLIISIIKTLEETGAITINSSDQKIYDISYNNPVSFEDVTKTDAFTEIKESMDKINEFKEKLMTADENHLRQLIGIA